jgi:hypothetical protein
LVPAYSLPQAAVFGMAERCHHELISGGIRHTFGVLGAAAPRAWQEP